ncbi:hypothetical protein ACQUSR_08065 [Streptomyces sp. P1-3]|uniref:hypothetical protein n=1 Tax=Streptomyces sp. P1-3 TaxID=3421658 RepID=UPI003D36E30C
MEPLSRDDPRSLGPYHVIGRLDPVAGTVPGTARRFIGRAAGGERTVLLAVSLAERAEDPGYLARFRAEAQAAWRLTGDPARPWQLGRLAPVAEVADQAQGPAWSAGPYLPVLPLPVALEVYGGPLPEGAVRALGAALAETLVALHVAGHAHAGISPDAVLIAEDGPRLAGFGAVRARPRTVNRGPGCRASRRTSCHRNRPRAGARDRWATCSRWELCLRTRPPGCRGRGRRTCPWGSGRRWAAPSLRTRRSAPPSTTSPACWRRPAARRAHGRRARWLRTSPAARRTPPGSPRCPGPRAAARPGGS